MSGERIFLDTAFIQAMLNRRDSLHNEALRVWPRVSAARETITTEAVIVEVCNGFSALNRNAAIEFVRGLLKNPRVTVIPATTKLFQRSLDIYEQHTDKHWGLTDCMSFIVMRDEEVHLAATSDRHFRQAGFTALMSSTED